MPIVIHDKCIILQINLPIGGTLGPNTYITYFDLKPAVRIPKDIIGFQINNKSSGTKITINAIEEESNSVKFQTGLRFRCELTADDIDQAINVAYHQVEFLCEIFCFIGGVGLSDPELWIAYDSTAEIEEREFRQFFSNPFNPSSSRRELSYSYLINLLNGFQPYGVAEADRLTRSLHWFRMGIIEQDEFDSYLCQWTALETLEPVFLKKMELVAEDRTCPHCEKILEGPKKVTGITAYLKSIDKKEVDLFWRLSRLRNDIVHGNESFQQLTERLRDLQPKLTNMLISSIHFLLNIPGMPTQNREMVKRGGINLLIIARLTDFNPNQQKDLLPHYDVENISFKPYILDSGVKFTVGWLQSPRFPEGVKAKELSIRAIGMDPDINFSNFSGKEESK